MELVRRVGRFGGVQTGRSIRSSSVELGVLA